MIDEAVEERLEARLRVAFDEMIPKVLSGTPPTVDLFARSTDEIPLQRDLTTRRPSHGLVAAGVLVAASVVGMLVVAQRDADQVDVGSSDTGTSVLGDGIVAEPEWYRLMRPLIPERFEYAALVRREPDEIQVVAVDADDGKALEIALSANPRSQPTTTALDAIGFWSETAQGWEVQPRSGDFSVAISCDIGARGRDFPGPPNYCDMTSTGAFTKAEIRGVVEAFAGAFDTSLFNTDIGEPTAHDVNPAFTTAMIHEAVPAQTPIADTDWGRGDRVFDFSIEGERPDTSVRVLQGLYPPPPVTAQAAYALYNDAAAFWMFGADGVAVRISSTDTFPEPLARLEELGRSLLASDALVTRPFDPDPSTTIEFDTPPSVVTSLLPSPPTTVYPAPGEP